MPSSIHVRTLPNNPSPMIAFQMIGIVSTVPTQFSAFCTLRYYASYLLVAHFNNMTSFYQCTAIMIQILTSLLQLNYQGTTDQTTTPFAAHPKTMLVLVSSSTINYLAYIALLRCPLRRFVRVAANLCLICSGYASVASLSSLLLPDSVRPYVYCIFVLVSAAEGFCCCKPVMEREEDEGVVFKASRRRSNGFLNNLCRAATYPRERRLHLLPV